MRALIAEMRIALDENEPADYTAATQLVAAYIKDLTASVDQAVHSRRKTYDHLSKLLADLLHKEGLYAGNAGQCMSLLLKLRDVARELGGGGVESKKPALKALSKLTNYGKDIKPPSKPKHTTGPKIVKGSSKAGAWAIYDPPTEPKK